MGFFSKELVRPGTSSLIAEITTNPGDGIHEMSDAALTERVIADLHREGLIDKPRGHRHRRHALEIRLPGL